MIYLLLINMSKANEICETFSKVCISNEMIFYKQMLNYGHEQYSQYSYHGNELKKMQGYERLFKLRHF